MGGPYLWERTGGSQLDTRASQGRVGRPTQAIRTLPRGAANLGRGPGLQPCSSLPFYGRYQLFQLGRAARREAAGRIDHGIGNDDRRITDTHADRAAAAVVDDILTYAFLSRRRPRKREESCGANSEAGRDALHNFLPSRRSCRRRDDAPLGLRFKSEIRDLLFPGDSDLDAVICDAPRVKPEVFQRLSSPATGPSTCRCGGSWRGSGRILPFKGRQTSRCA